MIQTIDMWSLKDTTVIQQDDSIMIVKIEEETKVFSIFIKGNTYLYWF